MAKSQLGKFITIEGLPYSGKTTQGRYLEEYLQTFGVTVNNYMDEDQSSIH